MERLEEQVAMNDENERRKEEMIENLKNQVQSLLKQQVEATDRMSFSSVQELQEKNMELMKQIQSRILNLFALFQMLKKNQKI